MTDRDHFAAAALAGLLDKSDAENVVEWWPQMACNAAYRWADAMLRERERKIEQSPSGYGSSGTINRNAPERQPPASECGGGLPLDAGAATSHHAAGGRGHISHSRTDEHGPIAWAVVYPSNEVGVIAFRIADAEERASASDRIEPLYRAPQPALTEAEREAIREAVGAYNDNDDDKECARIAATLYRLLERTK
jgi:hypothetical protein